MIQNNFLQSADSVFMKIRYIVLIIFLLYACFEFGLFPLPESKYSQPDIIAHRGDSENAPENTLSAFVHAIHRGADTVELDIRETKDGVLIALHDNNLRRQTGKNCNITNVTCEQLTGFNICTLEEVFALCKGRIRFLLDLKVPGAEEKVESLIQKYDLSASCEIASKDTYTLHKIKEKNQDITTLLLVSSVQDHFFSKDFAQYKESIDGYSIRSRYITASLVRFLHRKDKIIYAWTVNSTAEIQRMRHLGVDGIITDNLSSFMPDRTQS